MVFQLSSLQCEILKSNNPEWLELYTKQLLKFASTIEDLATKKQLFSIIATLNYNSNINESIFNKYIELIENDNNLKPEDKKPIVEMLENEKLIIKSPILFANDRLRNLIIQFKVVRPNNRKNMTSMLEETKNILTRTTEDDNLVAVLSSENKKPPIVCDVMLNNIDKMIAFDMLINDVMWTITNTIADIYEAGKISKEDVRKICSLDAVINNEQLKGVLRTQLQENSHLEKLIIASIRSPMHIKGRHDIIGEILAEELREIRN
jgi:arsenate reductase-like glutaredoxin family protein